MTEEKKINNEITEGNDKIENQKPEVITEKEMGALAKNSSITKEKGNSEENISLSYLQKLVNQTVDERELNKLLAHSPYKNDLEELGLSYNKSLLYIKLQEKQKSIVKEEPKPDNVIDIPSKLVEGSTTVNKTIPNKKVSMPATINNMTNEERKIYFSTR